MRFHDCSTAPSPRRVRIYLAEKGMEVPTVQVDLARDEQLTPEFRALNPRCTVPVLELDDGTCLWESFAICYYLERLQPEPVLMGRDSLEQSLVMQWNFRVEMDGMLAVAEALRNRARGFQGRAFTGPDNYEQIPELVERGRRRTLLFQRAMDTRLASSAYLAGETFTVADITALVAIDFAARIKLPITEDHPNLRRWHDEVSSRPGAVP